MQKDQFLTLVKNFTALTAKDASDLLALQSDFPYSQLVHNLAARAAKDNALDSSEHLLHVSAIYTTDRSVLKAIMSASRTERTGDEPIAVPTIDQERETVAVVSDEIPPLKVVQSETQSTPNTTVDESQTAVVPSESAGENELTGDALLKGIMADLKKLKASKHKFEVSLEAYEKHHSAEHSTGKKSKKAPDTDNLIEEIKTSKKKVAPEGKQKEQIEIIENFIKTKPSIKGKSSSSGHDDLAEKSLVYGDNIVSETLVDILLNQGKKDKAVEVLRKLIWKFPQKKAYFAARIAELKS